MSSGPGVPPERGTAWTVRQLLAAAGRAEHDDQAQTAQNPKPPGSMLDGAAPSRIERFLSAQPMAAWWDRPSLIQATGCTRRAVDWALIVLERYERVERRVVVRDSTVGARGRTSVYRASAASRTQEIARGNQARLDR
jgi:hypothetical protein